MTRIVQPRNHIRKVPARGGFVLVMSLLGMLATGPAQAATYKVLYNFKGGADGRYPYAGLVRDSAGNLYGTTSAGGDLSCGSGDGCGTVFKINTSGAESVLYAFTGGADGKYPYGGLVLAGAYLYGTASSGGKSGYGVVFKVNITTRVETVLHSFTYTDGAGPYASLVRDSAGNLYGTADYGGPSGYGVVFKLNNPNTETVLHSFAGYPTDGAYPEYASVVRDTAGNLYGVTTYGGSYGDGVAFKLDTTNKETVLYDFTGAADGGNPYGTLLRDSMGNLYGTAELGGAGASGCGYDGCGVVFKISTGGKEVVLHDFDNKDGQYPFGGLVPDPAGNLYGTTSSGGAFGSGVVFKLNTTNTETVLHSFDYSDGGDPIGGLVRDSAGNLYGTTYDGGASGYGVVFKLTP